MDKQTALLAMFQVLESTHGAPEDERRAALKRLAGLLDGGGIGENDGNDEDDGEEDDEDEG